MTIVSKGHISAFNKLTMTYQQTSARISEKGAKSSSHKQSTGSQHSEKHWQEVLNFRDLPILAETRDALRPKMKETQVCFDSLTPIIEQDPALCWHLLQETVSRNPDSKEQLTNARSCISLLGMKNFVALVKRLRVIDRQPKIYSEQVYRQALCTSHMAGCLAAQWAAARHAGSPSNLKWVAMLAHSVLWPWLLTHQSSHNWLHFLSQGDDLMTASHKVFGINNQHWHLLARRHNLPDHLVQLYSHESTLSRREWRILRRQDPRDSSKNRALVHQCNSDSIMAITAGNNAWQLHMAPEGKQARRWLNIASHMQGVPTQKIHHENRKTQLHEAHIRNSGLVSGLSLLASPEPTHREYDAYSTPEVEPQQLNEAALNPTQAENEAKEEAKPEEKVVSIISDEKPEQPDTSQPKQDIAYLSKLVHQLKDEPDSFGDWNYLIQGVLKGICEGVGLHHACILLPNKDRSYLRAVYAENATAIPALTNGKFKTHDVPLFRQLMKQVSSARINSTNQEQYLKGLPKAVAKEMAQNSLLMSVNAGGQPIGIIIGIQKQDSELSTQQYHHFKHLCSVTSKGLLSIKAHRYRAKVQG